MLKNHPWALLAILLPLSVALYMIFGAMSYQSGRVHYENINDFIPNALKEGNRLGHWRDYLQVFNMDRFETHEPRFSRPLSNFLLMLNHKIRSKLWQWFLPHPVLTPLLLIPLLLTPLFAFLFLRQRGHPWTLSLVLVAFYMATPGSLYPFYLNFRYGKMMVNCMLFFCWYWTDKTQRTDRPGHRFLLWAIVMSSWFWDETACLIWLSVCCFALAWQQPRPRFLLALGTQPLLYLFCVQWPFPYLAGQLGFFSRGFLHYPPLSQGTAIWQGLWEHLPLNFKLLMTDTWGIHSPLLPPSWWGRGIFLASALATGTLAILLAKNFWQRKKVAVMAKWLGIFLGLALLHTALMIAVNINFAGHFYLGAYLGPFTVLFLEEIFRQKLLCSRPFFWAVPAIVLAMIYKTHFLNLNIKYRAYTISDGIHALELDRINRYELAPPPNRALKAQTSQLWREYQHSHVMKDLYYGPEFFEFRYLFMEMQ